MTIQDLRKKIDKIDNQVLTLLEERAQHAKAIGDEKRKVLEATPSGQTPTVPNYYDPEREQNVIKRLEGQSQQNFPKAAIPLVFREIMSACRSLEADVKVAYLGPSGTFTQIATFQTFGHSVSHTEAATIEGVFDLVSRGETEYGVVPLENSCEGGVIQTLDAFLKSDVLIRREVVTKIKQCLVAKSDNLAAIRKVYSHPAALAQCRAWLSENLRGAELIAAKSTAAAARTAADEEGAAALASRLSAELLGLKVVREGVEDRDDNATRFVVICKNDAPITGADRTSIAVGLRNEKGALMKFLKTFDDAGITVSRTESRASNYSLWKYLYFIDFEGHREDPKIKTVLETLIRSSEKLKILGSYPSENAR